MRAWLEPKDHAVHFPDTKSGEQIRVIGGTAIHCIGSQPVREDSPYLFPSDVGDGHFIGVVRVLNRLCAKAKIAGVTPHVLRHTFARVAGDLGFSELTIAGLLGHAARGVTQGYVHLDAALVVAADQVADWQRSQRDIPLQSSQSSTGTLCAARSSLCRDGRRSDGSRVVRILSQ